MDRLKSDQARIIDCYCEVFPDRPTSNSPWIARRFPDTYKVKEVLDSVPKFTYPCGQHDFSVVTYFSFVLTNIDSKWTFGFCRTKPGSKICFVILSHLPWHSTFFKILNQIALLYYSNQDTLSTSASVAHNQQKDNLELFNFLKALYMYKVPSSSASQIPTSELKSIVLTYETSQRERKTISYDVPDTESLPSIPQNINLTEYYNALDHEIMIKIFASAINERHIIVTSRKLDRLSACVQAINILLYPMNWQHIFIPILPEDLLAYLQAPMPFIIGVHEKIFKKLRQEDLADSVILNLDENTSKSPYDDVKDLPPGVANSIRTDLKQSLSFGVSVGRAFLKALVMMIGGYREAIEFKDGQCITFNHERFVQTRPATYEKSLTKILELQMFRQFIENRLDMLKSGKGFIDDFELEVDFYNEKHTNKSTTRIDLQYQDWLNAMKRKGNFLVKSINPSFKLVCKGIKEKGQQAYRDCKDKLEKSSSSQQATKFFYSRME